MKKNLLLIAVCVIMSFFYQVEADQSLIYDNLSCYTQVIPNYNFDVTDDIVYFESPTNQLTITQNNIQLSLSEVTQSLKYVPFVSNIGTPNIWWENNNKQLYAFDSIDTNNEDTIELRVDNLSAGNFRVNFVHNAQYHDAVFFISDDGENYYRIGSQNASDFNVLKLKIVFTPNTSQTIREVIDISELNIERTNFIIWASGWDFSKTVDIYLYDSCDSTTPELLSIPADIVPRELMSPWQENYLFTQRTTDSDNDWINDLYDNCRVLSNTDQKDINQNNIGDACEFDSDNDGIPDEIDTCRNISNPWQADDDNDGIGNACDNCNLYNPNQIDSDNDWVWDICTQRKIYIAQNDDDSDGVINSQDNCKNISNPDQADWDNDWVWDSCDNCMSFQNPDQVDINENGVWDICEDSDSDGIESLQDNCPNIANSDQADRDNDGIWNLCEDDDKDGVIEIVDNCPLVYNPDQRDRDNDTYWDLCDDSDDRFLESNRVVFIGILILGIMFFLWAIYTMSQKLKK